MNSKTMNDQTLLDTANRLIEEYDLDNGKDETFIQNGDLYMTVAAPNNSTIGVYVEEPANLHPTAFKLKAMRQLAKHMLDFDADEEFNELWSIGFAEHNHFTPSQFINMLKEDEQFFHETAEHIIDESITIAAPSCIPVHNAMPV